MLSKLGFADIKHLLKEQCECVLGSEWVDKLEFVSNFDLIQRWLLQTKELLDLNKSAQILPLAKVFDLRIPLKKLSTEDNYLSEQEFFELLKNCLNAKAILEFFKEKELSHPSLFALISGISVPIEPIKEIPAIIDEKGQVKENASKKLSEISIEISQLERDIKKKIQQIFKLAQTEGWSTEPNLTVRDGRLVIPVLSEYKRKIKGFIHGESATGQTVFLEPAEAFEINNRIEDLHVERKKEIVKILKNLSRTIAPFKEDLEKSLKFLGILDFVRAKARFALRIDASMPVLSKEPIIKLYNAKHPLLFLSFLEQGKKVVPLNIEIDEYNRLIILSGPNAGGKSVCLKTIALLQNMLQHGLLIPASSHSQMGIFKKIYLDMGDDQNIESDLSTYSAHLTSMKKILENAGPHTLVFIDEFGAGTDPKFGGPIAESILEVINRKKSKGLITTHYSNLKTFASRTDGLQNASMLFDIQNLVPTFTFEAGKPGSSYALEIANKIGLQKEVIELARKKIGHERENLEQLLIQMEKEKKELDVLKISLAKREQEFNNLNIDLTEKKNFLEENKRKLLKESKKEFDELLKTTNKRIESVIREIKESNANNEKTKELRESLQQEIDGLEAKVFSTIKVGKVEKASTLNKELSKGDWVKVIDSEAYGTIVALKKDKIEIAIGNIKSIIDRSRLELVEKPKRKDLENASRGNSKLILNTQMEFNPLLDLRGLNGDDAVEELERFLDKSILMGAPQLKILHGIGHGILRKRTREYLLKNLGFAKFKDEEVEFGGAGITIIELL